MTPCPDLVAEAPKSVPYAPPFDRHRYSQGWELREGPSVDGQTQAGAAAGPRELAMRDRESEVTTKDGMVSYERARHSRPSPLKSTPALVEHGPEARTMDITGSHMLLALAVAFCLAGPLAWAFVTYWLFAP
jgi:hypothetical protein